MAKTVSDLLDRLHSGKMTVEQVAKKFRKRDWLAKAPATLGQLHGTEDEDAPDPDSWDAVNADSRLSPEDYQTLADAAGQ